MKIENLDERKKSDNAIEQLEYTLDDEKSQRTMPKKQIPLRLSAKLYDKIAAWAEDDFRSINGQIEYLLTECVKQRKINGKYVSETMDEPIELDIS